MHGEFRRNRYRRDLMAALADDLVARGRAPYGVEYRRLDAGWGCGEGHFERLDPSSGAWTEVAEWLAS